ncbi:MAG: SUMF1/EgtB/PvdO family nonheme iron enzyme, partial [Leptospirales bacterium]|nr:SUMF1/EgtB/PvdO family nonheme iron enzyme [Leptospirales bacterium]
AYNTNSDTIDDMTGWYSSNSNDMTHQVGLKAVNAFGLYDMHGNVYERCWDWYDSGYYSSSPLSDPMGAVVGSERVKRGGNCGNHELHMRSAARSSHPPYTGRGITMGFRVVRP